MDLLAWTIFCTNAVVVLLLAWFTHWHAKKIVAKMEEMHSDLFRLLKGPTTFTADPRRAPSDPPEGQMEEWKAKADALDALKADALDALRRKIRE